MKFKEEWGLDEDTKIYAVLGRYKPLRDELESRGMVEREWEYDEGSDGEETKEPVISLAFDFLYARKASHVFKMPLAPHQ